MKPGTTAYVGMQDFLTAHKGAGLACLVALFVLGRPAGIEELAPFAGYSRPSVRAGLLKLEERGWVTCFAYRGGWELTARARQLPLFGTLEPAELEKIFLVGGSSSGLSMGASLGEGDSPSPEASTALITATTTGPLEKIFPFEGRHIVQAILSLGKVGPAAAEKAVAAALAQGDSLPEIQARLDRCLEYARLPENRGIKYLGGWVASMIAGRYDPGPAADTDPWAETIALLKEREESTDV